MESIVGSPEWEKSVEEYIASMERAVAKGVFQEEWAHSGCSHAESYCAIAFNNVYVAGA
jgi:hypothetical protein